MSQHDSLALPAVGERLRIRFRFIFPVLLFIAAAASACMAEIPACPDRMTYPPLRFDPPRAERVVLENGIVLFTIENHEIPLVNISAVFRAGSNYDPPGKEGTAELTASLLRTGGTAAVPAERVDREIDDIAALVSFSADMESCSAEISVHKKDLETVMNLFSGMLKNPAFEASRLTTAKNLLKESLARVYDDQQRSAFREFRRLIYAGNPQGRLPSVRSVSGITREDLIAFHDRYFFPANTWIAVTGDISRAEALTLVKKHLGSWRRPGRRSQPVEPTAPDRGRFYLLDKKGPQSTVLSGYIVPGKTGQDFYALSVLDFILGSGGFRSRLFRQIRTERGLAYSAGGVYSPRPHYGVLQTYAATKTDSTAQVIELIRSILKNLREEPVSSSELLWAKRALTNRFIFSLDSPDRIAFQQMMLDFDGLPPDFLERYPAGIESVTVEDIRKAALKYLDPDKMLLLVVGDETRLKTLSGMGKATRIDWKE